MNNCAFCGSLLLFKGVTENNVRRYCNESCQANFHTISNTLLMDDAAASDEAMAIHNEDCPKCGKVGPIDFHSAHLVWSYFIFTQWKTNYELSCRKCGIKSKLKHAVVSTLVGWWGFPWGLIITPIQIARNLISIFTYDSNVISQRLLNEAKLRLYIKHGFDKNTTANLSQELNYYPQTILARMAKSWNDLKGWQRGIIGILIVLLFFGLIALGVYVYLVFAK